MIFRRRILRIAQNDNVENLYFLQQKGKSIMKEKYDLKNPPHDIDNDFREYIRNAYNNGEISKDEWYEARYTHLTNCYLASDNPRGQSGHGGDEYSYMVRHLPIIECLHKSGTFCDVGCANGHLMEMTHKWAAVIGFDMEMYGVDISEKLVELAQKRLPHWHDNFYVANRYFWKPEIKFDYIHLMEIAGGPEYDERTCFEYYMEHYLADGGRMIIGPCWFDKDNEIALYKSNVDLFASGITPDGYVEKTHYKYPNWITRAMWFDKKSVR